MVENNQQKHDIFSFEHKICEKLEELQWKTEALEDAKKELIVIRQQLQKQELNIEDERRKINELKRQIHSVTEINRMLEKENANHRTERHQLQVNYDLILRERDSLVELSRNLKTQNMQLNHEIQELKRLENINTAKQKSLEQNLQQLITEITQTSSVAESNLSKLSKEQDYLRKSVEGVMWMNKRLQTVGLCIHALYKRQENQIQSLQRKLVPAPCISPQASVDHILQSESQINPQLVMSELELQEEDLEKQLINILYELKSLSNKK